MDASTLLVFAVGLGVGAALGVLWMRGRVADRAALAEQVRALCADAVTHSGRQLLDFSDARSEMVLAPVKESLDHLDDRLREIEKSRAVLQATLREQIDAVRLSGEALRKETSALATALRKPHVRGRWGELHLAKAAELAGLVEHCDLTFQHTGVDDEGDTRRPDMVVHLAGGKHVVVDAKVPLEAFMDAAAVAGVSDPDETARDELLRTHAKQVRAHVDSLASKAYWRLLPATPEFVVLFMPGEAFLSHALEADPGLLEYASGRRVILATPTTLIALLRTVSYAWTEQALTANAREVFELGREVYRRLSTLGTHLDKLGRSLTTAVGSYNEAIGSLESRVLVTARRLHELELTDEDLTSPAPVEQGVRPLAARELISERDIV